MDVVTAAKKRLKNVFSNGVPVTMSFSGGKDSLCLAGLVEELARAGEIDITLLTVVFIDEEAIFPCIEETVKKWRLRFMALGARFLWFALEVKHYSCLNMLENDESFICFDHTKRDVWVREPPPFAIRKHPCHRGPSETYQQFLSRFQKGTIIDGFHRWTVAGREPLKTILGGMVPVVRVIHKDHAGDVYGTITHNRARGVHLLDPMKKIVKDLLKEGKSINEIGKEIGMKPEEVFRLSDFTREDFLKLMTKNVNGYSRAEIIKNV